MVEFCDGSCDFISDEMKKIGFILPINTMGSSETPGVRLQVVSDLHFEVRPSRFRQILKPSGDILVLAGNIGNPFSRIFEQFLHWTSLNFPFVVLVPGNHEYHGYALSKVHKRLGNLCDKYGVYYLQKDLLELPDHNVVILGTTLWSDIPHSETFKVLRSVKDYYSIPRFSFNVVDCLHSQNKEWLNQQISFYKKYNPEYHIVVATHHAPEMNHTIDPKCQLVVHSLASDCTSLMKDVDLWIYGHTQYNNTFKIGNTTVTSNQRGCSSYPVKGEAYSKVKTYFLKNEKSAKEI